MPGILAQKPRARHPLYRGLLAITAGCAIATLLALAGSMAIQDQVARLIAELAGSCTTGARGPACDTLARLQRDLLERTWAMLLLQALCALLVLVGLATLTGQGYRVLVTRLGSALRKAAPAHTDLPSQGDEFERVATALARLGARHAGLEAEVAWQKRISEEQVRRRTLSLQTAQEIADLFARTEASEWSLLEAMGMVEQALDAVTVAILLEPASRQALESATQICTRQAPSFTALTSDPGGMLARLVPSPTAAGGPSLVVGMQCRGRAVGTLLVELQAGAQPDETQLRLAELFARIGAIAIAGLSDSAEERRGALLEERSAIAGELHDSLAQSLAFMKIQVARLQRSLDNGEPPAESARIASELRSGLSTAYGEVRELIAAFRTRMSDAGLIASIEEAIEAVESQSGIEVDLQHELGRCRLEINEQFHILQVVRESLSNVARHSGAAQARVSLRYGPSHQMEVAIEDDGKGMKTPSGTNSHYGLSIMQERATLLGGTVSLQARNGGGTRVELLFAPKRLPTEAATESAT